VDSIEILMLSYFRRKKPLSIKLFFHKIIEHCLYILNENQIIIFQQKAMWFSIWQFFVPPQKTATFTDEK